MEMILVFAAGAALSAALLGWLFSTRVREARLQGRQEQEAQLATELATLSERLRARDEELMRLRVDLAEAHGLAEGLRQNVSDLRAHEAELMTTLDQERAGMREKLAGLEEARVSFADAF